MDAWQNNVTGAHLDTEGRMIERASNYSIEKQRSRGVGGLELGKV